eukprot:m.1116422 g.1116422  ORF g.1116422 m.1116422 type:complete len:1015 (+) comp24376_c0_seq2:198-3242(+)
MVKKKIDARVRTLIENGAALRQRTMFVVMGDKGRDQIVNLHYMLSKATVKARPSVLWCYKKELGFTTHRKKRMKELKKKMKHGLVDADEGDPFDLFLSATDIRFCYYNETHKVLGKTYGMCVLQDFEALSPNLLCRTVETVEGGGIIVLLLRTVTSLQQFYSMAMDVHSRFRTEAHNDVVCRFNERFLLSLKEMKHCLILDDTLDILPWASQSLAIEPVDPSVREGVTSSAEAAELKELISSLADTQPVGALVAKSKTMDQAKSILTFVEAISEKTLRSTVTLTAGRGRGKSASLGLAVAGAISYGYSNVFVTSPSPENLTTLFEFVFKGFDALGYEEHRDYELVQSSNPEFNKAIVRVNIFRESHRQTIQYIQPQDAHKLGQAELVCIDEAAAIPLPLVKALMGPYLVFLASTIHGYEGTGRSLSVKLIRQLREESSASAAAKAETTAGTRVLREIKLETPIRYAVGDPVEAWLESLLCLNATNSEASIATCPVPSSCELYEVNRDTLFSFNPVSELFLHRMMALYVSSHYKNTPNDLQLLSDAPAHKVFCLLGPVDPASASLPEILCVVQFALEGEISRDSARHVFANGMKVSGDMIPWTIGQQFQDDEFPHLSGGRIVRIATHPDYQGMGYGKRTLELLTAFYEGSLVGLSEDDDDGATDSPAPRRPTRLDMLEPRKDLPPLLRPVTAIKPENLDYLGVSFGLTSRLFKFWKWGGFLPLYLRQNINDLTGERSTIMIKPLGGKNGGIVSNQDDWVDKYWVDFRRRFVSLLSIAFRDLPPGLALSVVGAKKSSTETTQEPLTPAGLARVLTEFDLKRLHAYSLNLIDYHAIVDLVPQLARLWLDGSVPASITFTALQRALLVGMGFQHKTVDELATELGGVQASQLLALFSQAMRKFDKHFRGLQRAELEKQLPATSAPTLEPLSQSLKDAQADAAADAAERFTIAAADDDIAKAAGGNRGGAVPTTISVKSAKKPKVKRITEEEPDAPSGDSKKRRKDKKKSQKGKPQGKH